jgi:ATP-dependent exoDNAse (exonuclease V) beta subunit
LLETTVSTVRADPRAGVGFLNDIRRMNVALTRAKFACYVIGSEATLRSSKPWTALLDHAHNRRCVVHVENPKCNLLTLQPMLRSDAAHLAGGQQPPPHFPPPQLMGAPFAPPHHQQQQMDGTWQHDSGTSRFWQYH